MSVNASVNASRRGRVEEKSNSEIRSDTVQSNPAITLSSRGKTKSE